MKIAQAVLLYGICLLGVVGATLAADRRAGNSTSGTDLYADLPAGYPRTPESADRWRHFMQQAEAFKQQAGTQLQSTKDAGAQQRGAIVPDAQSVYQSQIRNAQPFSGSQGRPQSSLDIARRALELQRSGSTAEALKFLESHTQAAKGAIALQREGATPDAIAAIEPHLEGDLSKATPLQLARLCVGYLDHREYAKTSSCREEMQRRIDSGGRYWCRHPTLVDETACRRAKETIDDWLEFALAIDAQLAFDYGDYVKAIQAHDERIRVRREGGAGGDRREDPASEASELAFSSLASALSGDQARAQRDFEALETVVNKYHGLLGSFANQHLARLYFALGSYPEALEAATRGRDQLDRTTLGLRQFEIPLDFVRAKALERLGRYDEAEIAFDALLTTRALPSLRELYWYALFGKARLLLRKGDTEEAIKRLRRAVDVIEEMRATIPSEAGRIGFVEDKQEVYRLLIEALVRMDRAAEAFGYVERAKARALVDLLAGQREFGGKGGSRPEVQSLLAELEAEELATLVRSAEVEPEELVARRTRGLKVKARIQEEAPDIAALVTVAVTEAAALQRAIGRGETLLEYYLQGDTFLAFVVTRGSLDAVRLQSGGLDNEIELYRDQLQTPYSEDHLATSRRLYGRLIAPVEQSLGDGLLSIVPHGVLHYLPFAALHSGGAYLLDRHPIRYLPSASVLPLLGTGAGGARNMLVLGNPDLGKAEYSLPSAEQEAKELAARYSDATLLLGAAATESLVRDRGSEYRRLHFASHAEYDWEDPLASRLLLTPDGANDGRLTASEVYALSLEADLVTLSACETALGEVRGGDDVIGLTRGFLFAGAESLVVTLWPVADQTTKDLMLSFYRQLEDTDKAEALRGSQIAIRGQYPHPFYWAPFQVIGKAG